MGGHIVLLGVAVVQVGSRLEEERLMRNNWGHRLFCNSSHVVKVFIVLPLIDDMRGLWHVSRTTPLHVSSRLGSYRKCPVEKRAKESLLKITTSLGSLQTESSEYLERNTWIFNGTLIKSVDQMIWLPQAQRDAENNIRSNLFARGLELMRRRHQSNLLW